MLYIVNSIVNMSLPYISNVCISLDILAILVLYVFNFISNVYVRIDLLAILVLIIKFFNTKFYNPQAQTTPKCRYIAKLKSSARRISAAQSGLVKPRTLVGRIELDSHVNTIVHYRTNHS